MEQFLAVPTGDGPDGRPHRRAAVDLSQAQFEVERFRPTWEYVMALVVALFAFIDLALLYW